VLVESLGVVDHGLGEHLPGDAFFDADRYPEVRFRGTKPPVRA
jgi:polyisoprenoid-binding protein YceI